MVHEWISWGEFGGQRRGLCALNVAVKSSLVYGMRVANSWACNNNNENMINQESTLDPGSELGRDSFRDGSPIFVLCEVSRRNESSFLRQPIDRVCCVREKRVSMYVRAKLHVRNSAPPVPSVLSRSFHRTFHVLSISLLTITTFFYLTWQFTTILRL